MSRRTDAVHRMMNRYAFLVLGVLSAACRAPAGASSVPGGGPDHDASPGSGVDAGPSDARGGAGRDATADASPTPKLAGPCGPVACYHGRRIVPAGDHTCALRRDGTVACWGANLQGQSTPPPGVFVDLFALGFGTCGVRVDGEIVCWGMESGPKAPRGPFVSVDWAMRGCALRADGTPVCWSAADAAPVTPPGGPFVQLALAVADANRTPIGTCGLRPDGKVVCWDDHGPRDFPLDGVFTQIMSGTPLALSADGQVVGFAVLPADKGPFVQIARYGERWVCGRRRDGTVACPAEVSPIAGVFSEIQGELGGYICGLHPDNTADCTGLGYAGSAIAQTEPIAAVSAGNSAGCWLTTTGTVRCWSDAGEWFPPPGPFVSLAVGVQARDEGTWGVNLYDFACGIRRAGDLECWGAVTVKSPGPWKQVITAADTICTLGIDGKVACNALPDVLGRPGGGANVPDGPFQWLAENHRDARMCGLRVDGSIVCWAADGRDATKPRVLAGHYTTLGHAEGWVYAVRADRKLLFWNATSDDPFLTVDGPFIDVTAGSTFQLCALRAEGSLLCFDLSGKTIVAPPQPPFVRLGHTVQGTCGITAVGELHCWGGEARQPL
jgi:hypothetical protein